MAKFKFKSKKYYKKEIGIEYKKKGATPQLWETSDQMHKKRAKEFFGIR
jgi:hypothetical protein